MEVLKIAIELLKELSIQRIFDLTANDDNYFKFDPFSTQSSNFILSNDWVPNVQLADEVKTVEEKLEQFLSLMYLWHTKLIVPIVVLKFGFIFHQNSQDVFRSQSIQDWIFQIQKLSDKVG